MPVPALTHKLKKYRRRFGVSPPRVVVRRHMPLSLLWLFSVLFAVVMFGVGWLASNYWRKESGGGVGVRGELQLHHEELASLRSMAGTGQNALSIERAAHQHLLFRISVLEAENSALKEELRIFERLLPPDSEGGNRPNKKVSR